MWGVRQSMAHYEQMAWESAMRSHKFYTDTKKRAEESLAKSVKNLEALEAKHPMLKKAAEPKDWCSCQSKFVFRCGCMEDF